MNNMFKYNLTTDEKRLIISFIISLFATNSNINAPTHLYDAAKSAENKKDYKEFFSNRNIQDIKTALTEWLLPNNSWEFHIVTGKSQEELKLILEKLS